MTHLNPCKNGEKSLSLEVVYLSVYWCIMYIVNYICLDIGTISNIYYTMFMELLIWFYFIEENQSYNYLNT